MWCPQGGRSNLCQERRTCIQAHGSLCKIKTISVGLLHQWNSRGLDRASAVWYSPFTHHLLHVCLRVYSPCGIYKLYVCSLLLFMSQIASAHMCWSTHSLKQTSLTVFFFVFLSFSLTLPFYYSMSTVAMETILLFLSSLLVCVAGKCPPHTHTHIRNTHAYTSMHTNTHAGTH